RDFRLLLVALLLAVIPTLLFVAIYRILVIPPLWANLSLFTLPLLSLAYLYTAFRRRLGDLELRVNRFFTVYVFVTLVAMFGLIFIAFLEQIPDAPGKTTTIGFTSLLFAAAVYIGVYPAFERSIDQRVFGVVPTSKRLLEAFSTHITTSISLADLIRVLQEEVFPSLLIRQFAFLQYEQGSLNALSTVGLYDEPLPSEMDISYLMEQSGKYRSPDLMTGEQSFPWVRLILPLRLGNQLHGFWLLGRRDPDDLYPQQDNLTLSSLANLTAIALSNILQTERLTSMYQANINRYEEERVSLARDLHDSILNELAALPIRSDAPVFSPAFQDAYDSISDHLREITHNLRPSMLSFGLKLALEDYAENLRQRNTHSAEIQTDIQTDGDHRYPLMIEGNVYRIVQEACENSLRYAHGKSLSISGNLMENQIDILVSDDGVGLDPDTHLNFNDLLTHRHFGLAGMHERASVIGAELHIVSKPNEGTQIHLTWQSKETT
ncbi:MAG TPA: ATP-binding protein, partial [Anaerolineales bacterium]|nr:ATP-binding protein [Anaerolineales bacterium]